MEPVDWTRVLLICAMVAAASGGGLAAAGLLRQGPLDDLGWTERERPAFAMATPPSPEDRTLNVVFDLPDGACPDRLTVEVEETPSTVVLGGRSREPLLGLTGCPQATGRGRPVAAAHLTAPLGDRPVLSAGSMRRLGTLRQPTPTTAADAG